MIAFNVYTWKRRARLIGLSVALGLLAPIDAWAEVVYTVDSVLDQVDDSTADGVCHTTAGTCTLRAAVMQANHIGGAGATILLPAGTYVLNAPIDADGDDSGDLNLTAPASGYPIITITGAGAATTIIDANHLDRVLSVASGRGAAISGVTFRNGLIGDKSEGGGISNSGDLALTDCIVSNNYAEVDGGGIHSDGTLTLTRVTLDGNEAYAGTGGGIYAGSLQLSQCTVNGNQSRGGGGIYIRGAASMATVNSTRITDNTTLGNANFTGGGITNEGSLTIDQSTLSGNQSGYHGGGIVTLAGSTLYLKRSTLSGNTAGNGAGIFNEGALFVIDSTLSGNSATDSGGGIYNRGTSNVYSSTIAFNQADSDGDSVGWGAGIYNDVGAGFNLRNTVVAGNVLPGDHAINDCYGALQSWGANMFSDESNCTLTQIGPGSYSLLASLNELGVLRDNGGPTFTHALVPPSAMIDGGDPTSGCIDQNGQTVATDQRGFPRVAGARCDIGAFEYSDVIFRNGFEHFEP